MVGFTELKVKTITKEILLTSRIVKGEIASPNCPHFPGRIADFGLKYRILKGNTKNRTSGRSPYSLRKFFPPWLILMLPPIVAVRRKEKLEALSSM